MTTKRTATLVATALLLALAGNAMGERRSFLRAVREDASSRGVEPGDLRRPSQWPLELYDTALAGVSDPLAAQAVILRSDGVKYYVVPLVGTTSDSTLVQVFQFRLGPRVNEVVIEFRRNGRVRIDGSDATPAAAYEVTAEAATRWFDREVTRERRLS
jgi:hypothetical protein